MANSIDALNSRFAVSKFDVTKKLSDDQITLLKDSLRLTPSSMNIQPWKFTLSDLRTKLSDGNFEFTTLVDCCMHEYFIDIIYF